MTKERILIVEDEVIVGTDLRSKMEKIGYEVVAIVRYGEDVLETARRTMPHLVLMDIQLKGEMDGVAAADQIGEHLGIPVVFLTAFSDDATLGRARVTAPYSYLKKPVSLEALKITVQMALYKGRVDQERKAQALKFRTVADFTYDWEIWIGPDGKIRYMSPSCERITGYPRSAFLDDPELLNRIVNDAGNAGGASMVADHLRSESDCVREAFAITRKDGAVRWIEHICQPVVADDGTPLGRRVSNRDITLRKQLEATREAVILELQAALKHNKILRGLLPICSNCKKIRDDQGYWCQIESYIRDHSDIDFSHGICPDCLKLLYPDFADEIDK